MRGHIIPARGVVEFHAFNLPGDPMITISVRGPHQGQWIELDDTETAKWMRPVVGLLIDDDMSSSAGQFKWLNGVEPIIVDDVGCLYTVSDYVAEHHCADDSGVQFYRPHIDGPVTDTPRIRLRVQPHTTRGGERPAGRYCFADCPDCEANP